MPRLGNDLNDHAEDSVPMHLFVVVGTGRRGEYVQETFTKIQKRVIAMKISLCFF
jgi:hypothetical protein